MSDGRAMSRLAALFRRRRHLGLLLYCAQCEAPICGHIVDLRGDGNLPVPEHVCQNNDRPADTSTGLPAGGNRPSSDRGQAPAPGHPYHIDDLVRRGDVIDVVTERMLYHRVHDGADGYEDACTDILDALTGWCHPEVAIQDRCGHSERARTMTDGRARVKHPVVAWARCWPLHIWALMGLIAWGLLSVEWFVLWELVGACAVFQRIEAAR